MYERVKVSIRVLGKAKGQAHACSCLAAVS
jgi:hypothetical protein